MRLTDHDDLGIHKPSDHLLCVSRQIGLGGKAAKCSAHQLLTGAIIATPSFEDGGHARAELWIYIVQCNQLIDHQRIGRSVRLVKGRRRHGQGSNQGAETVWIFQSKIRVFQQIARNIHRLAGRASADL